MSMQERYFIYVIDKAVYECQNQGNQGLAKLILAGLPNIEFEYFTVLAVVIVYVVLSYLCSMKRD